MNMCGIIYLSLQEVAEKLKLKRTDTAVRWCINNGVHMFKLLNKNVVDEYEFRLAYEQPLIDRLKMKYKDKWVEYYKAVIGNYNCTVFGNWECTENGNKDAQFSMLKVD
jgi:hypothetical protein